MKNDHFSNHQHFEGIDYAFRPESYWDVAADPLGAILVNVKGTRRRQMIRDYWDAGAVDDLQQGLLLDCLGEEDRTGLGKIHPSFMGGEYLPDYEEGEVEIARIELESTTADVISIRVKKEGERIAYLIVDEYETEFNILPTHSDKPLTLSELVRLIDGAMEEGSLGLYYTQMNYEEGERSIEWLDQMRHFTRVESVFYPQLNLHYEKLLDLWYEEKKAKLLSRFPGARTE
jgi:hypothetical protein